MKREVLHLLLVISLAFNVAFIGMFVWHQINKPERDERPEMRPLREEFKKESGELKKARNDFMEERKNFWDYLHSEEYTEAGADSLLEEMLQQQILMERMLGNKLIELKKKGELPDKPDREPPYRQEKRNQRRRK